MINTIEELRARCEENKEQGFESGIFHFILDENSHIDIRYKKGDYSLNLGWYTKSDPDFSYLYITGMRISEQVDLLYKLAGVIAIDLSKVFQREVPKTIVLEENQELKKVDRQMHRHMGMVDAYEKVLFTNKEIHLEQR